MKEAHRGLRVVEVVRVMAFTALRADAGSDCSRIRMVDEFLKCNFDVSRQLYRGGGSGSEKCVDVAMAVEMVALAHVPDAFDIAGNTYSNELWLLVMPISCWLAQWLYRGIRTSSLPCTRSAKGAREWPSARSGTAAITI